MELHKGHGPASFKIYQMIEGISLFLAIVGGLTVGLLARPYRRKTMVSLLLGTAALPAAGIWAMMSGEFLLPKQRAATMVGKAGKHDLTL